jgi:hypothetical protein
MFWSESPDPTFNNPYVSKTVYEINYTDKTYWQAHFNSVLEDFKSDIFTLSSEALKAQLWDWQGLVGKQTLSPMAYEQGVHALAAYVKHHPDAAFVNTRVFSEILTEFKNEMQEQTTFTLENFEADVLKSIVLFIDRKMTWKEASETIYYYHDLMPAKLYNAVIKKLQHLSTQGPLTVNAYQQFRKEFITFLLNAQTELPRLNFQSNYFDKAENIHESKSYSLVWDTLQSLGDYVLYHPLQAITAGLALQVAAVAALGQMNERNLVKQDTTGEFLINTNTFDFQGYPSAATFDNNNFVVTWFSNGQDSSGEGVYGQLFNNATSKRIGTEFRVNTYTIGDQWFQNMATFANSNFVVAWESDGQDGSLGGIYGQLFNATDGVVGTEFQINTYTMNNQAFPNTATFTSNNFIVVWHSFPGQDGSGSGVYGQLFNPISMKIGAEFQVNTYSIGDQGEACAATFTNNNFVVMWQSANQTASNSNYDIYGQLFDNIGRKIGPEFQANSYITDTQDNAKVATFPNNNFAVIWESYGQDGSDYGVYGQLFNANVGRIGPEFQVNTYTTNNQYSHSVATFPNNNFIVTWMSTEQNAEDNIYGQMFNATGGRIGVEFQVNTNTYASGFPSVATFPNNNFLVTWQSWGQDGSNEAVIGRIFDTSSLHFYSANQVGSYTEDTPQLLPILAVEMPVFFFTVSAQLTMMPLLGGSLSIGTSGNVTSVYNATTGIWEAIGLLDDVNSLLSTLIFYPSLNFNQNLTINAEIGNGYDPNVKGTINLVGIPVNDSPVLQTSNGSVTYVANMAQIKEIIDAELSITDIDSPNLINAIVWFSEEWVSAEDRLAFTNQSGLTGSYDDINGILKITGVVSTTFYQTALESVEYYNVLSSPTISPRTISFQVFDAGAASNIANKTIEIVTSSITGTSSITNALTSTTSTLSITSSTNSTMATNGAISTSSSSLTTGESDPAASLSSHNTAAIIGGAVSGGAVLLLLLGGLAYWRLRQKQPSHARESRLAIEFTENESGSPDEGLLSSWKQPEPPITIVPLFSNNNNEEPSTQSSKLLLNNFDPPLVIASNSLTWQVKLGEGSFGIVYQGMWKHNDVAIKQLKNTQLSFKAIDEFTHEMQIMTQFRSPQIIQLYGVVIDKMPYSLVMEYMPKGSLYTVLHSREALSWELRENIALDIAKGLDYLHTVHQVLHRDLKSANVLLDNQYNAKLTDFGLSRVKTEISSLSGSTMVGTIHWMAPEVLQEKLYSEKSDIYSYGMTLWELASRELPFKTANGNQTLIADWIKEGQREALPKDVTPKLAKLITWGWAQKASDRPTAEQAIQVLKRNKLSNN